ncbi:hypothetical protein GUITHDRAFT_136227 [Guillardia theta CCMP2712]|uniref:PDZ domain-containing protein n=1 Tax=Guillardia theta (strain CCMP2712) TaxID=905079 RepID=L1JL26_GUITC|nr:hypothetical protein GUITHDRAFT_136227 [Guillardia theta CCMP2712]EKX49042.1 hypothetical protein GUITHDRAFT_136227 [Guillardia theta CCMP2712]|eukprot:XP_005836022.1 hypothetical protein GUITHDRAFT_136227 [Guillardia theta CCMP2712]
MGNEQSVVPGIDMCCAKRSSAKQSDRREQVDEGDLLVRSKPEKRILSSISQVVWPAGNPETRMAMITPEKVGIGAYFQKSPDEPGCLAVKSLVDGPAKKCGKIKTGDIIVAVDGYNVYGKKLAELAEHLLGPKGTEVSLTFKSKSQSTLDQEYTVKLVRG